LDHPEGKPSSQSVMKSWVLIFMDGTTHKVEAFDLSDAWVMGKIIAQQRGTYLLNVREKL